MIERIARRAGGFASTTALRWLGAAGEALPDAIAPTRDTGHGKLRAGAVTGAAAGAVALLSNKTVREGVERTLRAASQGLRSETNGTPRSSTNGNGSGDLSEKTRDELYALARKMNVRGRSAMSKDALVEALSK